MEIPFLVNEKAGGIDPTNQWYSNEQLCDLLFKTRNSASTGLFLSSDM